jgi:hypothetical protein
MHLGTRSLVKETMLGRRKKDKGNEVLEHELSLLAASNPEKLLESERVIRETELNMKLLVSLRRGKSCVRLKVLIPPQRWHFFSRGTEQSKGGKSDIEFGA